jgi:hypothetical protein
MIVWLNLNENSRWNPNENYARELMELFTLGADRGAYTEQDVRNLARALTGFDFEWSDELGMYDFRYVPERHDTGSKTIFGHTGAFTWEQGVAMCVHHPMHPSFFVNKLWSYFIATPPSDSDRQALESLYASGGYQVRPVLEAILLHPDFHAGARMVKPPVVFVAASADAPAEHRRRAVGLVLPGAPAAALLPAGRIRLGRLALARHEHGAGTLRRRVRGALRPVPDGDAVDNYDETETAGAAVAAARAGRAIRT